MPTDSAVRVYLYDKDLFDAAGVPRGWVLVPDPRGKGGLLLDNSGHGYRAAFFNVSPLLVEKLFVTGRPLAGRFPGRTEEGLLDSLLALGGAA